MDLAEACMVRMTELNERCKVWTVDHADVLAYRRHGRQAVPTEFPPIHQGRGCPMVTAADLISHRHAVRSAGISRPQRSAGVGFDEDAHRLPDLPPDTHGMAHGL